MEEEYSLATELLHEVKKSSKRWFVTWIITMILLFITNIVWLYAWWLPTSSTDTTIEAQDEGNAVYNEEGDVSIGKNSN